jgi:hypothetical protein
MRTISLATLFLSMSLLSRSLFGDFSNYNIQTAEEITYDWLVKLGEETGETNHVQHLKQIFKHFKVKRLLEFGVGLSTQYFLNSCNQVVSVEFITHGYGPERFKDFLNLYRNSSNWIPIAYFSGFLGDASFAPYKYLGSEHLYKAASYQSATCKNYAVFDDFYLTELNAFIRNLIRFRRIDLAFVNTVGVYNRGDLVQLLFSKVPVIVARDTSTRAMNAGDDLYGYDRVVTPEDYEEIYLPLGQGTTVWVAKEDTLQDLIQALKKYAQGF